MSDLKDQLIKLGSEHTELREDLRPVLDHLTKSKTSAITNTNRGAIQDAVVDGEYVFWQEVMLALGEEDERKRRELALEAKGSPKLQTAMREAIEDWIANRQ